MYGLRMETIRLIDTLPDVFAGQPEVKSDVWNREVVFQKGKTYLVEAASGTGKTSLCSFIYGYRNDYKGDICFDDVSIRQIRLKGWLGIRKENISLLFQDLRLFNELTAWENVEIKNALTCFKTQEEIERLFSRMQLSGKRHCLAGELSYGQQQRVAFIRALCQPYDFILLDEPVSHLDEENNRIMAEMLQEEAVSKGAGILVMSVGKHLSLDYSEFMRL